jgi:predicted RNase H-like nuclease (RuvC/YqgF family)
MKVQDILDALSTSEIVQELVVLVLVKEPAKQALRAKVSLKGGYVMYVTEAFGKGFRSYSYHIQKDGKMVRRWDNAPHWPEMKTFPHYFHMNREKEALECQEFFALDVLREIKGIIKREGC